MFGILVLLIMEYLIILILGYLIGTIPFSQWITKKKLTHYGSTNIYRNVGFLKGLLVQTLDILKGITVIFIEPQYQVLYLMCVMVGQILPCIWNKKGGKGVNVLLGGILILFPSLAIFGIAGFSVILVESKYVSLASLTAVLFVSMILTSVINPIFFYFFLLVLITHWNNIEKILNGTENKISIC